jgi:hypothetical protein
MPDVDLRPCPFCAFGKPTLAALGDDQVERVAVICPECCAVGPTATADDGPGYAEHLWNQRYGLN